MSCCRRRRHWASKLQPQRLRADAMSPSSKRPTGCCPRSDRTRSAGMPSASRRQGRGDHVRRFRQAGHRRRLELHDGRIVTPPIWSWSASASSRDRSRHASLGLQMPARHPGDHPALPPIDGIYAAGDVAEQWSRCHDRWMRLENWANAQNQAIATAKNMAGEATGLRCAALVLVRSIRRQYPDRRPSRRRRRNRQGRRRRWTFHDPQHPRR